MGHVQAQRYLRNEVPVALYRAGQMDEGLCRPSGRRRIWTIGAEAETEKYRSPRRPEQVLPSYQPTTIIENTGYRPGKRSARRIISQVRRMTHQRRLSAATRYFWTRRCSAVSAHWSRSCAHAYCVGLVLRRWRKRYKSSAKAAARDPVTVFPTPTGSPDYPPIASAKISRSGRPLRSRRPVAHGNRLRSRRRGVLGCPV